MPQRKSGHVTLIDVARESGFSASTVSIVLSEAPLSKRVTAQTKQHIREVARRLGYHPDEQARSLRRRSSQTVGVLAFDLSDPFCLPIVRGIQAGLQSSAYLPLVLDAQTQRKLFDNYLNLLLERRVEGVIVIASWVFEETDLLSDIRKNRVPIVIVGRDLSARGIASILVDNQEGGRIAMRHLAGIGHRKIALILGPRELSDSDPRWKGIQQAAGEHNVLVDPLLTFRLPGLGDSEAAFNGGCEIAEKMLELRKRFTAVLAFDDMTALGVVRALTKSGRRVPEDCSVMGFDDILPAKVSTPAMTTVRQPFHEMGLRAAQNILSALHQPELQKEKVTCFRSPPELVIRESTLVPKKQR